MSDYHNKKKYKKKKEKERARKAKAKKKGAAIREENREEKFIERIQWQNRSRITPLRKVVEEE